MYSVVMRHALRMLVKSPGFAAVAISTLALGIGANTAIFTVANALLLRPLPFADPARLVAISGFPRNQHNLGGAVSYPFSQFVTERQQSYTGVAECTFEIFSLTGHGQPEQILSARVSSGFFDLLGVPPLLGRAFRPEEDRPGGKPVVVISYEFWTRIFARNRDAIGRTLDLNSDAYTIIGVLPPRFNFPLVGVNVDLWAPRVFDLSYVTPARVAAGGPYFHLIGRLKPGVSRQHAQAEAAVLYQQYRRDKPGAYDATLDLQMSIGDLQDRIVSNLRPLLLILSAAVGLVLLIACANVASLLLARSLGRKKEFAVRTALGAPRRVLIRQLLAESVLLSLLSGGVGVLLGLAGTRFLSTLSTETFPQIATVQSGLDMDGRVLLFTLVISIASGVLFGLTPSLQLSKPDLHSMLRDEGRGSSANRSRSRARRLLVVGQVALSMVLLVGSGLLVRSFLRLRAASPGFDPKNLLTMDITLPPAKYSTAARLTSFYDQVLERVQRIPGVESAALSTALPAEPNHQTPVLFEGQPPLVLGKRPIVFIQQLSPDYAKTLHVPLLAGRVFSAHDDAKAPRAAILNQSAAEQFFAGQDPVGKRVWIGTLPNPFQVVGVLADVKNAGLALPPQAEVFLPLPQLVSTYMCLSLRTRLDPHGVIAAVRREIAAVDPDQPLTRVQSGDELLESASAQPRFIMLLIGLFAATAFLLAALGIYGVIAYSVAQRTGELGIRIALGAAGRDIFRLVVGDGLSLTLIGIAIGLAASLTLTRLLSSLLYDTSATDPVTFALCAVLFTAVAALASYLPARRATRVDPAATLRA